MIIHTERLVLREFVAEDWASVLEYQSDPLYLRYVEWTERTPEAVQEFVQKFLDQQQEEPRLRFQMAMTLKATGELIGNCGIRKEAAHKREAEIGYEISPRHWGHGYATEAARAIVRFGFEDLGLHRVGAWCVAENAGSVRVLEKAGMRLEGRLRDKEYFKGKWWDALLFGMTEDDWRRQG